VNESSIPIISIDLSDGSTFKFDSFEDASVWLDKEQAAFGWLAEGGTQAGAGVSNLRQRYIKSTSILREKLNQWRRAPDNEEFKEEFANAFRNAYASETSTRSDHEFARIAADIATKDGSVAAAAAYGVLLGIDSELSFKAVKGIIEATLKKAGIDPKSPDLVSKTIADLNSSASTDRARSISEWSGITDRAHALLEDIEKSFKTKMADLDMSNAEMVARVNESTNSSIKSIENTESAYKEQMKLQASVAYWNSKAAAHRKAGKSSRLTLVGFTALGGVALLSALFWIATTAIDVAGKSTADTAIFFKFAAIGAVATTIIFWIGRVLLRIYLSDRHLLTDAEEESPWFRPISR
jgi:hypothetical protein